MRAVNAQRIEAGIGYVAAGSFAAAVGFAAYQLVEPMAGLPAMIAAAAASSIAAYPLALLMLRALEGEPKPFWQPTFEMIEIEPVATTLDELVLTDADKFIPSSNGEPLILEDVLPEIAPESRVVQLFDPAAMPAARELRTRTGCLDGGGRQSPDASEALFEALADLRRSLR